MNSTDKKLYCIDQNNSGGYYLPPAERIYLEAESLGVAEERFDAIFDPSFACCDTCGERWNFYVVTPSSEAWWLPTEEELASVKTVGYALRDEIDETGRRKPRITQKKDTINMPTEERTASNPFGLTNERDDSYEPAKELAVRLVKFFALAAEEFRLSPEQQIYGMELAALNVLNAEDCPLDFDAKQKVRADAFKYYTEAVRELP